MNYSVICEKTKSLVKQVGAFVLEEKLKLGESGIEKKGKNDFVTYVDKESEKLLVAGLLEILPEAGFITEEKTINKTGDVFNWIIDPIDGTTNFIHGCPPFCISVALKENEDLVIGIVLEMSANECFWAYKGGGAFCNDKQIFVSQNKTIDDALVATGFPYNDYSRLDEFKDTMVFFMHNSHGLRRLGSAAADLAYVACGRFDAFYEYGLKPWDIAAGLVLLKEAGGKACDFDKGNNYLFGGELISANAQVFDEISSEISKIMSKK